MKIWITGGSGGIGSVLVPYLRSHEGQGVLVVSRSKGDAQWDPSKDEFPEGLEEGDVIVNLCGQGIMDKKWSDERKKVLLDSRVEPLRAIGRWIEQAQVRPKAIITASGINYYPNVEDMDGPTYDESGPRGEDYICELTELWEIAAVELEKYAPVARLRFAMVLMKDSGAFPQFKSLAGKGMMAPLGKGTQPMPWIHVEDICRLVAAIIEKPVSEAINVAVEPVPSSTQFTKEFNSALGAKRLAPKAPKFAMRLLYGESADLMLKGPKVSNARMKGLVGELAFEDLGKAAQELNA